MKIILIICLLWSCITVHGNPSWKIKSFFRRVSESAEKPVLPLDTFEFEFYHLNKKKIDNREIVSLNMEASLLDELSTKCNEEYLLTGICAVEIHVVDFKLLNPTPELAYVEMIRVDDEFALTVGDDHIFALNKIDKSSPVKFRIIGKDDMIENKQLKKVAQTNQN